jgi:hypothetical protein
MGIIKVVVKPKNTGAPYSEKRAEFIGATLRELRSFPADVRKLVGDA